MFELATKTTRAALAFGALCSAAAAHAGIYTCTDAAGRRLSADRPIPECLDRPQRVLDASGAVRRTLGPSLSALDKAAEEERQKQASLDAQRLTEKTQLDRALLARFPTASAFEDYRGQAVAAAQESMASTRQRIAAFEAQRVRLQATAAAQRDPHPLPAALQADLAFTAQQIAYLESLLATQEAEQRHLQARLEAQLSRLQPLWAKRNS